MTLAEMDAFIATNLFGQELSFKKCAECSGTGYILDPDPDPDEGACCGQIKCPKCGGKPYYLLGYPKPTRDYSADIKAAWEVVEKLGELGYTVHIEWKGLDQKYSEVAEVIITKDSDIVGHAVDGTFPAAICNATIRGLEETPQYIKCINTSGSPYLTIGENYLVLLTKYNSVLIENVSDWLPKTLFEPLKIQV